MTATREELDQEIVGYDTADIQHDLAMMLADGDDDVYTQSFTEELKRRGAPLPVNCRIEFTPSHRFKRQLVYDLKG